MDIEKILDRYHSNLKDTIFKEIMHYEILESFFKLKDIQNTLIFQGGTALRLCYNNDRYSEDLDFAIHKDREFNKEFIDYFKAIFIEKIIQKYNLQAEIIEPKDYKINNRVQRWSARVYLPNNHKKAKINIKIANIPSHYNNFKPLKNNYEELIDKRIFVQVEELEEILADKIIALSQRPYLKFRDLWDIEWLRNNRVVINYELINLKIQDYKCENFVESLQTRRVELDNANDTRLENDFLNEMSRFLDSEYFEQIKNIHFFSHIQKTILREIDDILGYLNEKNLNIRRQR